MNTKSFHNGYLEGLKKAFNIVVLTTFEERTLGSALVGIGNEIAAISESEAKEIKKIMQKVKGLYDTKK